MESVYEPIFFMPFALIIIGAVLLVASVRNSQDDLFTLVKGDFSGQGNFVFWVVSLLIIGAVGYIPKLKPISDGFLVLVIIVLFLTKGDPTKASGGFFQKFGQAVSSTTTPPAQTTGGNVQQTSLQSLAPLGGIVNQTLAV